jgi:hypothetical protein
MVYVLIIITSVYGGVNVTTQEFNSKSACESAAKIVSKRLTEKWMYWSVDCVNRQTGDE